MARGRNRSRAIVFYRDVPYAKDLHRIRQALVERQVSGKVSRSNPMEHLARQISRSRSTTSRFFSANGPSTGLDTTMAILAKLGLDFEDVFTRLELTDPEVRRFLNS